MLSKVSSVQNYFYWELSLLWLVKLRPFLRERDVERAELLHWLEITYMKALRILFIKKINKN
jgi:hypothetical protein